MDSDSPPKLLPLAEAVLAWSDPALLAAVRAAEAAFAPGELERGDRDPLDTLTERHMRPMRARTIHLADNRYGPLDRAWTKLLDAFRLMIERGDVYLAGRQTKPVIKGEPEPLPGMWATELAFDVRGAAVFFGDRTFVAVTASKETLAIAHPAQTGPRESGSAPAAETPISLKDALVGWTDPALVTAVKEQERRFTPYQMSHVVGYPRLSRPEELHQPSPHSWMAGPPDFSRLWEAWSALERDFKSRLVRRQVFLYGVPSVPVRSTTHVPIPGVWAADLEFDFLNDAIQLDDTRYIAVIVSQSELPQMETLVNSGAAAAAGPQALPLADIDDGVEEDSEGAQPRQRGRASSTPLIRQALRDCWQEVQSLVQRRDDRQPVWTELARMLEKRLRRRVSKEPGLNVPHVQTIRTRLPKIYAEVLSEKAVRD